MTAGIQVSTNAGPVAVSGTQRVMLSTTTTVTPGTYTLEVQGYSDGQIANAPLTVQVQPTLPASFVRINQDAFDHFGDTTNPSNGLTPDHYSTADGPSSYASIAATASRSAHIRSAYRTGGPHPRQHRVRLSLRPAS